MAFREVLIRVEDEPKADFLIAEFDKLEKIYEEQGENHGYTMVAQVFASKGGVPYFFLSGRVLNPEESKAFAEILEKSKQKNG